MKLDAALLDKVCGLVVFREPERVAVTSPQDGACVARVCAVQRVPHAIHCKSRGAAAHGPLLHLSVCAHKRMRHGGGDALIVQRSPVALELVELVLEQHGDLCRGERRRARRAVAVEHAHEILIRPASELALDDDRVLHVWAAALHVDDSDGEVHRIDLREEVAVVADVEIVLVEERRVGRALRGRRVEPLPQRHIGKRRERERALAKHRLGRARALAPTARVLRSGAALPFAFHRRPVASGRATTAPIVRESAQRACDHIREHRARNGICLHPLERAAPELGRNLVHDRVAPKIDARDARVCLHCTEELAERAARDIVRLKNDSLEHMSLRKRGHKLVNRPVGRLVGVAERLRDVKLSQRGGERNGAQQANYGRRANGVSAERESHKRRRRNDHHANVVDIAVAEAGPLEPEGAEPRYAKRRGNQPRERRPRERNVAQSQIQGGGVARGRPQMLTKSLANRGRRLCALALGMRGVLLNKLVQEGGGVFVAWLWALDEASSHKAPAEIVEA
eukprot:Amastigsp_a1459_27.p2 type:complete len:511 gc:universal Amastigsp_a1459_27:555-2087(+)